jgi:sporulation protein YlmC with PRC-barrel domain
MKLAVVAAAVAAALGSSAQEQQPRENAQQQQPTRENANRPAAEQQVARSDSGTQTLEQYLQSNTLRVSTLAGMELKSRSGDSLGEIHDVIRGAAAGQDMQLIVQLSGVGAEEKMVAIPFDELQVSGDGEELHTNRTREQLAAAPAVELERRQTPTLAQRDATDANRSAAERGAAQPDAGEPRATQPAAPGASGQQSGVASGMAERRLADLVGAEVLGTGDESIGEVDDIVISTAGADSVRAVLQVGGIAGIGEKRVSLPLSQVNVDRSDDGEPTLRVAMDREALERLPEFQYEERTSVL